MKKLYLYSLLIVSSIANAQNTGINTNNPQQTLDIEGTLGISQPGEANQNIATYSPDDANLLYWNPKNKKIVTLENNNIQNFKPFKRVKYRLALKEKQKANIKNLDLNIDASKYTIFIVGYRLLVYYRTHEETDEIKQDVVYIPAIQFPDGDLNNRTPGTPYTDKDFYQRITLSGSNDLNKGFVVTDDTNQWAYSKMVVSPPKVYVKQEGKKWKLYAYYHKIAPKTFHYKYFWFEHKQLDKTKHGLNYDNRYVWNVDLLIVDNKYITDLGEIKATATKPDKQDSRFEPTEMQKVKKGLKEIAAP